jgi:hypothetical protein
MRRYIRPVLRLSAFLAALVGVLLYLDYRAAEASVVEHLLGIGQRMAPYLDDGRATEAPRQVRINGVRLFVAAGHTSHPPSFVKKWYRDRYAAKGDALDQMATELRKKNALPEGMSLNELSFGDDQEGGMAALDFGEKLSLASLKSRFATFIKTGELGDLARLRYVWYEKNDAGGTRFLTVWSDDKFSLSHLMPAGRVDADGSDIEGVPRYPGSVRVLSAEERGMSQRLAVYDGAGSPGNAELFYRARMETLGWMCDESFAKMAQSKGKTALRFDNKAGHEVIVYLGTGARRQGVLVTIVQTR